NFRANNAPSVKTTISDVSVGKNSGETVIDLAGNFDDSDITNSQIRFDTSAGPINVELLDKQAPRTVANFFNYINSNRFDNTIFHRLETGFVLQGGGFAFQASPANLVPVLTDPAVQNEFVAPSNPKEVVNAPGTIAMAKVASDPNSATSQFFFNLGNNSDLDTENGGF